MAKIIVLGTVTRLFYKDMGVEVSESYKSRDGETKFRRYTAWFTEPVNFSDGATGEFSGQLSTKIDTYTGKDGVERQTIKVQINDTEFKATSLGFAPLTTAAAPAVEPDLMPF